MTRTFKRNSFVIIRKLRAGSALRLRDRALVIDRFGEEIWRCLDGFATNQAVSERVAYLYGELEMAERAVSAFVACLLEIGFVAPIEYPLTREGASQPEFNENVAP